VRQIWVADADGGNASPLTSFSAGVAGSPKWSPDGQFVVFDARPEGNADIYTVPSGGGQVKRLTNAPGDDLVPFWSRDNWIYFGSARLGGTQVFRMRPDGSAVQQVTHNGGFYGEVSPDGKWLYYSVPTKGLWKMPPDGGEATQVLAPPLLYTQFSFGLTADGIYAMGASQPEGFPVVLYPFDGGAPRTLTTLSRAAFLFMTVSPDGHWFLYSNADDPTYGIMLVDNFR
jgi:Tol biopolymer transport system component